MRYILPDGVLVTGRGYADIVRQMNDAKMTPAVNMDVYRRALAARVSELYGEFVDATTDKTLIQSLEAVGLIIRTA